MNDPIGSVKLYHRSGAPCVLPVALGAEAAFASVDAYLAAGFAVNLPGLEPGEQSEQVACVIRGNHKKDGRTTPYLLLYSVRPELKHSFLKVYLNTDEAVADFEYASKIRLASIPLYIGKDKPERGADHDFDNEYMIRPPVPFGCLYRDNPKYSEEEAAEEKSKGGTYIVPKRLFVRWANQRPDSEPSSAQQHEHPAARQHQPPATQGRIIPPQGGSGKAPPQANEWRDDLKPRAYEFLRTNANLASFNKFYAALAGEDGSFTKVPPQDQGALTDAIHKFAQARGWYYDGNGYSETPATMNDVPF